MSIKLKFLFVILIIPQISGECLEGWWRAGDACYTTSHSRMTWYTAQEVKLSGWFITLKLIALFLM